MLDDQRWIGKTFDDFLFRPQRGMAESRREINLGSPLSRKLTLEFPVVSANMDSVTGMAMARAMAYEGGLGFIHRGLSIERQAEKVALVKRSWGTVIEEPLSLPRGASIRDAKNFARRHGVTALLIVEKEGSETLAGVLTQRDIPWMEGYDERTVEDFMTPFDELITGPPETSVEEAEKVLFSKRIERLPLVDQERRIHGLITRKDILFMRNRPLASKDTKGRLLVGAAVGARGDFVERAQELLRAGVDILVIDIAHGHSRVMREAVERLRAEVGDVQLVCGNVATFQGARFLKELGADAVKVGVGPGRGCRTRLETAAGVPQLQAVREAWCALKDEIPIIADGGVVHDKDIFLALMTGASSVMLGSALSGTDEAPGHVIEDPSTHSKKKIYRGMTSPQAVFESLYDAENPEELKDALETPAEGQEMQVPYKGALADVLQRIRGHLQSAVSYAGEESLQAARAKIVPKALEYLIPLSASARRESYER
ncbi:MAG TPA: IMP dehydrogenase [Acidobacteriota bacterium]|nr:IMP dehydrogenase [Acidobacteriota bacterium]